MGNTMDIPWKDNCYTALTELHLIQESPIGLVKINKNMHEHEIALYLNNNILSQSFSSCTGKQKFSNRHMANL